MTPDTTRSSFGEIRNSLTGRLRIPVAIFLIALILRLIFLLLMLGEHGTQPLAGLFDDSAKYIKAADCLFGISTTGQYELYLVGPGYPFFLGIINIIFGRVDWLVMALQIIMSGLTCVGIYLIARRLIANDTVAVLAGLIAAVSMTSISLANSLLTETLFLFLLVLSLERFFKGLAENRWTSFAAAGILGGLAVLVRSAAMFFPVLLVLFAVIIPAGWIRARRGQLILKAVVTALIMTVISLGWAARNSAVHDVFTVAGTGMGAARLYLAGRVVYAVGERPPHEYRAFRDSLYESTVPDIRAGKYKKLNEEATAFVTATMREYPARFIWTYISTIIHNMTVISTLEYAQIPQLGGIFEFFDRRFSPGYKNPIILILTLTGFIILARRSLRIAIILLSVVVYFGAASGITFGQGSRVYFPAQAAYAIFVSAALLFFYDLIRWLMRSFVGILKQKA